MNFKSVLWLTGIIFLTSCGEQDKMEIVGSASAFDLTQAKAAIKQSGLSIAKAFEKDDTASIMNAYTKDATVLPAGHEALGDDSIRYYLFRLMNSNVKSVDLKSEGVWGDSTLVAEVGTYSLDGKEKEDIDEGKYIVLWKRESGNWKIYRQMWTSDFRESKIVLDTMQPINAIKK